MRLEKTRAARLTTGKQIGATIPCGIRELPEVATWAQCAANHLPHLNRKRWTLISASRGASTPQ